MIPDDPLAYLIETIRLNNGSMTRNEFFNMFSGKKPGFDHWLETLKHAIKTGAVIRTENPVAYYL
jgi:hypothetical protein